MRLDRVRRRRASSRSCGVSNVIAIAALGVETAGWLGEARPSATEAAGRRDRLGAPRRISGLHGIEGLNLRRWVELGPAVRDGVQRGGWRTRRSLEWDLSEDAGEFVLSSRLSRNVNFTDFPYRRARPRGLHAMPFAAIRSGILLDGSAGNDKKLSGTT